MAVILSTNITSPLGLTTEETYQAVRIGRTGLQHFQCEEGETGWKDLPFSIEASLLRDEQWAKIGEEGLTSFERIVMYSVKEALSATVIDKDRTVFILSSTKGDVELLDEGREVPPLGEVVRKISVTLGIKNEPIVVCNACISGVSAIILGQRLVDAGYYSNAIVCGADIQSRFIVSGFQSFKALSPEPCRPFDIERLGLNLGEAAATVILSKDSNDKTAWNVEAGAVRNDAYHISAPHPKGEGAYIALASVTEGISAEKLAVICVHGTATMYNDQMESKAIERAELQGIPLSALKGYFGHTMGAAGVLETILTARALDDGIILPTYGYEIRGVSGKVILSAKEIATEKKSFVKMLSGFGGCNGAVRIAPFQPPHLGEESVCKGLETRWEESARMPHELQSTHAVKITHDGISVDGISMELQCKGKEMLTEVYKTKVGNYPKFYKMDMLSKLAFIAGELLVSTEDPLTTSPHRGGDGGETSDRAIVLFNKTSSIVADRQYEASIYNKEEFFPSPSVFVYTLPNITTGEIAIRHGYHGETSFYILPEKNERIMSEVLQSTFADPATKSIIGGWIDCPDDNSFECELKIYE